MKCRFGGAECTKAFGKMIKYFSIFIYGTSCIKLIDYKTYFPKREKFPLETMYDFSPRNDTSDTTDCIVRYFATGKIG